MKIKLLSCALALLLFSSLTTSWAQNYYQLGDTLRTAKLASIKGDSVSLDTYSGKILFLNFFASW